MGEKLAIISKVYLSLLAGERIDAAMKAAILLDDFATGLDIPIAIVGHNTSLNQKGTAIYLHTLFDRTGKTDSYRLAQICACASNRDGMALI